MGLGDVCPSPTGVTDIPDPKCWTGKNTLSSNHVSSLSNNPKSERIPSIRLSIPPSRLETENTDVDGVLA